jgi:hypothetical protein
MTNWLAIGVVVVGTLALAGPVFAEQDARAENRSGVLVKVGLDTPGTHDVEGGGLSGDTDVEGGGFIAGEIYATVHPRVELGVGGEVQFPRSQQDFTGDFGFIPIYGVARLFPVVGPVSLYATGRIGVNLFFGDDDYKGSGSLEGGGHLGAGAGLLVHQRVQVEALYSINTGVYEIGGTSFDITYSKVGISLGYLF